MKFPTYAEAENIGYDRAEYRIDWGAGERKYKEVFDCVRVYENDLVQITRSGRNNPYWRQELANRFDCRFTMLSELVYVTLHDPESGSKVHKAHLDDTLYFHDVERSRLYKVGKWGQADIQFVSKHAQPSVLDDIVYFLPNKVKEKAMHDSLAEHYALGETLNLLHEKDNHVDYAVRYLNNCSDVLSGKDKVPKNLTTEKTQMFCRRIAFNRVATEAMIFRETRTRVTTKFIEIRQKEK